MFQILAAATNVIAEGEVMQLINSGNPEIDETTYREVIQRKTAKLFEAAARLGAVLGGAAPALEEALARYGTHLGTAFQLIDDVLDYTGDHAAIGKNLGDDLAEGKPTLPLIRALAVGSPEEAALIRGAVKEPADWPISAQCSLRCSAPAHSTTRERAPERKAGWPALVWTRCRLRLGAKSC